MKIVHICLATFYIDGYGYQENLLSEFNALDGHSVTVLTSDYIFNKDGISLHRESSDYYNEQGIHVITLNRSHRYPFFSKLKDFDGVFDHLESEKPDLIFVHGGQFWALKDVIRYCRKNRDIELYIDQHGDYYNMPVNTAKQIVLHKVLYGHWMRKAQKYCSCFWGVTPWRCQYLHDVYNIKRDKIDLLVMGGDDRHIHIDNKVEIRKNIRLRLDLSGDDFVLITGGKIDLTKNIHLLMQSIKNINNENLKLIVFGQPSLEMVSVINDLAKDIHIRYIGWLDSKDVYDYFLASDLAVFPGTHSVLWEQACACGLPGVFKDWPGMHHVDLGGNCKFLNNCSVDGIEKVITEIYYDHNLYNEMKRVAISKCVETFSYKSISRKAIGM